MWPKPRVVIDTNVLVAGLRKTGGASFRIIEAAHQGKVIPIISVPLVLEYEEVLKRPGMLPLSTMDVDVFLDFWCRLATEQIIYYRWKPFLPDADDDMLVELAVAGRAEFLVTANLRHLGPAVSLGIRVVTPADFLGIISAG